MNHRSAFFIAFATLFATQSWAARATSALDGTWQIADRQKVSKLCPPSLTISTEVRSKPDSEKNASVLDPDSGRYTVQYLSSNGAKLLEWSGSTIASQYPAGENKETAFVTYTGISSQKAWNNCAKMTFFNCSGTQDFSVHSSDGLSLNFKIQKKGLSLPATSAECEYKK